MRQHKRTYRKEFKLEAIRLYESCRKRMRQIEEELGISAGLLNKWRARHRDDGQQAFVRKGHQTGLEEKSYFGYRGITFYPPKKIATATGTQAPWRLGD